MTRHLGLSLTDAHCRALLIENGAIVWRSARDLAQEERLADAIAGVLSSMPVRRWPPPRVSVSVGLCWSQLKQLAGLPPTSDERLLTQVVLENGPSFFLGTGARQVVSDVARRADGTLWAAAFDHAGVDEVRQSMCALGMTKVRFLPAAQCVAFLLASGTHRWREGADVVDMTIGTAGLVLAIKRLRASGTQHDEPPPSVVARFGEDGWRDAPAYGAAIAPRNSPFAWHPEPDAAQVTHRRRLRIAAAAAICITAATVALAAPALRAKMFVERISTERARVQESQRETARLTAELRATTTSLDRIERFNSQRGAVTVLLGALSQALPESTALATLRIDSLEGSIVVVTPHAADVLSEITDVGNVIAPRIVGSVTRETVGATRLERATIRFRRPRGAR